MAIDYCVCPYDDVPCFRKRKCLVKVHDARLPFYVCVRVRFRGRNSTVDRGLGMTVYEKLKQQRLFLEEFNRKKGKVKRV